MKKKNFLLSLHWLIDSVSMRVNDAFPYSFTSLLIPHRQNMLKFTRDFSYCCLTNVHVKILCISAFMDHVHSSDDLWRGRKVPLEPIWSHQGMSLYFPLPKSVVIEYIQYQLTLHFFILDLATFRISTHSSWQDGSQSQP